MEELLWVGFYGAAIAIAGAVLREIVCRGPPW